MKTMINSTNGIHVNASNSENVLVKAEKVISKVLSDLKCCYEDGEAILKQARSGSLIKMREADKQ